MSSIAPSVFTQLSSLSLNLQNSDGTFRIFPTYEKMADKEYPAIVYTLDDYQPDYCLDGSDQVPTVTLKITAIANNYDDADALAQAVANALDGTRGTWGTTVVRGCFLEEMSDDHFVDTDLETILYFMKTLDFKVIYDA